MKKTLILIALVLMASAGLLAQDKTSNVKHITYKEFLKEIWDFEKHPDDFVFKGKVPAVVDFYADWCAPCRKVAPILEKLANEYEGKMNVYKINVDNEKELASVFQVRSIPMLMFIPKEGKPMVQMGAMSETQFKEVIDKNLMPRAN